LFPFGPLRQAGRGTAARQKNRGHFREFILHNEGASGIRKKMKRFYRIYRHYPFPFRFLQREETGSPKFLNN
jgi:hypothetical protein